MAYCQIKDDPTAQSFCRYLESDLKLPLSQVDTGDTEFVVTEEEGQYRADSVLKGANDSVVSALEAYKEIISVADSRNWLARPFGRPDLDFLKDKGVPNGRLDIPWIPTDAVRPKITKRVASIEAELEKVPFFKGDWIYDVEFGRRLFKELGVEAQGDLKNCVRFADFFLMHADLAGIKALPALLLRGSSERHLVHVAVAFLKWDKSSIGEIANIARPGSLEKPRPGELWVTISRRDLLAFNYMLKGVEEKDLKKKREYVATALKLSPNNYLALFNMAYIAYTGGKYQEALDLNLRATLSNPLYPPAYWNLSLAAEAVGDSKLSRWARKRYQDSNR